MLYGVAATRLYDSPETRANLVAALNRAPGLLHTASLADGDRYQGMAVSPERHGRGGRQRPRSHPALRRAVAASVQDPDLSKSTLHSGRCLHGRRDRPARFRGSGFLGQRHGAVLWDLNTASPVGAPFGPMMPLAGRPLADGDSVAILTGSPGTVEIWSLSPPGAGPGALPPRHRAHHVCRPGTDAPLCSVGPADTVIVDGITGQVLRRMPVPAGRNVSPDGLTLLVAEGSDVGVWDVGGATGSAEIAGGSRRGVARQHTGSVLTMVWGADSRTFATTSDDRTTIVWDAATLRPVEVFSGTPGRQVQVGYSADGRSLYTAGQDGGVYLWDLTGNRREETQLDPAGPYAGGKIDPPERICNLRSCRATAPSLPRASGRTTST